MFWRKEGGIQLEVGLNWIATGYQGQWGAEPARRASLREERSPPLGRPPSHVRHVSTYRQTCRRSQSHTPKFIFHWCSAALEVFFSPVGLPEPHPGHSPWEGSSWQPSSVLPVRALLFPPTPFSTSVFTRGLLKRSADVRQVCNTGSRPAQTVDGGFLQSRCTTCFTLVWHSKQAEIIIQTTPQCKNVKPIRRLFSRHPGCVLVSFLIGESKGDGLTLAFISTFRLRWTRARLYAGMCWSCKYVTDGAIRDSLV